MTESGPTFAALHAVLPNLSNLNSSIRTFEERSTNLVFALSTASHTFASEVKSNLKLKFTISVKFNC
jgi:hypothetical protein